MFNECFRLSIRALVAKI